VFYHVFWEDIDPKNDTSLALIIECVKSGHGVAMCSPENLIIRDSVTNAFYIVISRIDKTPNTIKGSYKKVDSTLKT